MPIQTALLFPKLPSPEWLFTRQERGVFRAAIQFSVGPYEGFAVVSKEGRHHPATLPVQLDVGSRTRTSALSFNLLPPIPPLPPGPPVLNMPPDDHVVLCAVRLLRGSRAVYGEHLEANTGGLAVTTGALLGSSHYNLLIEAVGPDLDDLLAGIDTLLEHDAVDRADVLYAPGDLAQGLGPEAPPPAT